STRNASPPTSCPWELASARAAQAWSMRPRPVRGEHRIPARFRTFRTSQTLSLRFGLQIRVEPVEARAPHVAKPLDPEGDLIEAPWLQPPQALLGGLPRLDQTCRFQHLQMTRNGGLAHLKRPGELGHAGFAHREPGEDRAACGIGQG